MKRTVKPPTFLLPGVILVGIGILGVVICLITLPVQAEDAPKPEKKIDDRDVKQTEKEEKVPTSRVETNSKTDSMSEGHVCEPPDDLDRVKIDNSDGVNQQTIGKEVIEGTSKESKRRFSEDGRIRTTILIGDARMDRWEGPEADARYIGYLKADRIIFKEENRERTFTVARGNVEFCRNGIRITSDHARQNHRTGVIHFISSKEKWVVITDGIDTVCTPHFVYNQITGKQIAKGEVKFRLYIDSPDAVDENTINETDTPSDASKNTENRTEKKINAETDNADGDAAEPPDAGNFEDANPEEE